MQNLIRVLIVLIIANLVFMAGLEIQRRTIWSEEADYLRKIEAFMISNEKSTASYEYIQRQLGDIDDRVNAVQIATLENASVAARVKDMHERIMQIESAVSSQQTAAETKDIRDRVMHIESMLASQTPARPGTPAP